MLALLLVACNILGINASPQIDTGTTRYCLPSGLNVSNISEFHRSRLAQPKVRELARREIKQGINWGVIRFTPHFDPTQPYEGGIGATELGISGKGNLPA